MDDLTASASRQAQLAPSWRVLKERGIDAPESLAPPHHGRMFDEQAPSARHDFDGSAAAGPDVEPQ
jgi:hypothetical protein